MRKRLGFVGWGFVCVLISINSIKAQDNLSLENKKIEVINFQLNDFTV